MMPDRGPAPMQIAVLIFEGCDLLDAGGPYEVFLTASRLAQRLGQPRPFVVHMVTIDGQPVTAYGGLGLIPSGAPELLHSADVVIVPGALDLDRLSGQTAVIDAMARRVNNPASVTASVCTGSFLLAAAGLLDGRGWTTHWEDVDTLALEIGEAGARRGVRWVDEGAVVTGGALSSGLAVALHLVARFVGRELAEATARQLDYRWDNQSLVGDDGNAVVPANGNGSR